MKKKRVLALGAFASFTLLSCAACSDMIGGSSVPEYEGMSISQSSPSTKLANKKSVKKVGEGLDSSETGTDNTDSPDVSEDTPEVPEYDNHEEKDDTLEEGIEDLVTIDVQTDDEVKYYVQPNETFTIEIHLSNPDQYEIQSFTLNGKKYSNYMFKDGSTMELLLLETTAPSTPGYFEYTIDAIKYIDGTEIKDVKMSGDKTVKTGIEYPTAPTATVSNMDVSTTYIDLGIDVADPYSLIGTNELSVYLSDGETVLDAKPLTIGESSIKFDNLEAHTLYEYGVAATFDLVDGRDTHSEWLLKDTFTTQGIYSLSNVQSTKTSISFDVDKNGEAGEIDSISLYDNSNGRLVASGDSSTRSFDNLLSDHTYKIYVDFSYTIDGTKIADWVGQDVTTVAKIKPTIEITDISADKTSVSYKINMEDADDVSSIDKVALLKNGEVVDSNQGNTEGTFDGLLSNNTYGIEVSYTYDLNDGNGTQSGNVTQAVSTISKVTPQIRITDVSSDQTTVSYEFVTTDEDEICTIDKVELLKDGIEVASNNGLASGTFDNLLSNNSYTIRVEYSYDLNDGNGVIHSFVEQEITTVAKAKPVVGINEDEVTDSSISADVIFTDIDSIGMIDSIELYNDDEIVAVNSSNEVNFTGLDYYTDYRVVINYSYDLNDGKGMVKEKYEKAYKTSPYIGFDSCEIINTSAVSEGETIYIEANIENPLSAMPKSVVVNGESYNCTGSTSPNRIYVEVVNAGQFEGGDTLLSIEQLTMTLDGIDYSIVPTSNNSDTVFINGKLLIDSVKVVDESGKEIDYAMPGEKTYLEVNLNNKTGYDIDSITINDEEIVSFEKVNDNKYRKPIELKEGWNTFFLNSISYSNKTVNKKLDSGLFSNHVYAANTDEIVEISNVEELMSTSFDGGLYKLTNDIDLSGIEWTNLGAFNGVFDGDGHKILNMSNVSTVYDKDVTIGLFESINGLVMDTSIENTKIIIDVISDNSHNHNIGMFAANNFESPSIFKNCHVDGDIQIKDENANTCYIGGFIGTGYSCRDFLTFENSSSNVNINAILPSKRNTKAYQIACGLLAATYYGYMSYENPCETLTVKNCDIKGYISCPGNDAGIINIDCNPNDNVSCIFEGNTCQAVINDLTIDVVNDFVGTGLHNILSSQPEGAWGLDW